MPITTIGRDIEARQLFGAGSVGLEGVSTTAPGTTTYTLDGKSAPGSTSAWNGQIITAGSTSVGCVFGRIVSNTNASPPVLTVDGWFKNSAPSTVATTPLAGPWAIAPTTFPGIWVAISANSSAPATPSTSTSLPGEVTTAGGGLIRQPSVIAHTAGTNTDTATGTFTANASDSLPLVADRAGYFNSPVPGNTTSTMMYDDQLASSATLAAIGDQLTLTYTFTQT
jgi:hypothetical protein